MQAKKTSERGLALEGLIILSIFFTPYGSTNFKKKFLDSMKVKKKN